MLYIIVSILIFVVSFVFAMLGLGGGTVYVPILKWAGFSMKEVAIPLGLLLNGLNTLLALIPFTRKKLVDWKGGLAMAVAALIFSPLGAYTSQFVPEKPLMLLFTLAVIVAAARTLWSSNKKEPEEVMPLMKRSVIGAGVGAFAGFVGGLLGIGGGFIIAPILMWMGYKTKEAAATTAFVVTFSSFSGYLGHAAEGQMNWPLTIVVVLAVIIASQLGAMFMSGKAKPKMVKQVYGIVLLLIAVKLIWGVL
jgi:uncharacterized membrane protein YfcA